jgi:hypothetical protein
MVKTKNDVITIIKKLKSFNKEDKSIVTANIDNKELQTETVSINRYEYLKDGFKEILNCNHQLSSIEKVATVVNGKDINHRPVTFTTKHRIDDFIEKELHAYRDNDCVCWKLEDGVYKYNLLNDELVRINED